MINDFHGRYRFLSNFYPCSIEFEGIIFPSVEHAYQAAKILLYSERIAIAELDKPGDAKRASRRMAIQPNWEEKKYGVMATLLKEKFKSGILAQKLKATYPQELIEGNYWHDNVWGSCNCQRCKGIIGQNLLGKILMRVREEVVR